MQIVRDESLGYFRKSRFNIDNKFLESFWARSSWYKGVKRTYFRSRSRTRESLSKFTGAWEFAMILDVSLHNKNTTTSKLWMLSLTFDLTRVMKSKRFKDCSQKPPKNLVIYDWSRVRRAILFKIQTQTKALKSLFTESVLNRMIKCVFFIHVFVVAVVWLIHSTNSLRILLLTKFESGLTPFCC